MTSTGLYPTPRNTQTPPSLCPHLRSRSPMFDNTHHPTRPNTPTPLPSLALQLSDVGHPALAVLH